MRLPDSDAEELQRKAQILLASGSELELGALKRRGWKAVAIAEPLQDAQAARLVGAAEYFQVDRGFAVLTEHAAEAFRFGFNVDDLQHVHAEALLRPLLLWPDGFEFAVLDEGDFFLVAAGPEEFVSRAVGCSIEDARRDYEEAVLAMKYSPATEKWMLETGRRYSDL